MEVDERRRMARVRVVVAAQIVLRVGEVEAAGVEALVVDDGFRLTSVEHRQPRVVRVRLAHVLLDERRTRRRERAAEALEHRAHVVATVAAAAFNVDVIVGEHVGDVIVNNGVIEFEADLLIGWRWDWRHRHGTSLQMYVIHVESMIPLGVIRRHQFMHGTQRWCLVKARHVTQDNRCRLLVALLLELVVSQHRALDACYVVSVLILIAMSKQHVIDDVSSVDAAAATVRTAMQLAGAL